MEITSLPITNIDPSVFYKMFGYYFKMDAQTGKWVNKGKTLKK